MEVIEKDDIRDEIWENMSSRFDDPIAPIPLNVWLRKKKKDMEKRGIEYSNLKEAAFWYVEQYYIALIFHKIDDFKISSLTQIIHLIAKFQKEEQNLFSHPILKEWEENKVTIK